MVSIREEIRAFVVDTFLLGRVDIGLDDEESLLGRGIVDRGGVLELVTFLEGRYGIQVKPNEIVPDNLDSIETAARFVERKIGKRE